MFTLQNCGPVNETGWCRSDWSNAFTKAQATLNAASRNAQYKALQAAVWQDSGYVIWGYGNGLDAVAPRVMGFIPGYELPFGDGNFKDFWLA